ncbi:MAG: type VII toxin-antitoxin system HepT family RNase toxin [Candidatus Rokuibacteriota bacterium]
MPANPEVIRSKLLDVSEAVNRLRSWLPITPDRLEQDVMLRWAVEHGLHIAAEALFDAGNHLLSGEFQETADEYREIAPRLVARGVLSSATAKRLESLAGFRNVLVHDYATVDIRRVHAGLGRLDDFEAFVADVENWLARAGR